MEKMIYTMKLLCLVGSLVMIAACTITQSPPLKPVAKDLLIVGILPDSQCQYVSQVISESTNTFPLSNQLITTFEINAMRNAALRLNTNVLVFNSSTLEYLQDLRTQQNYFN